MPTSSAAAHLAAGGRDRLLLGVRVAQAFSKGGDVALLGRSQKSFLTGVGCFSLAHLAYITGFWSAPHESSPTPRCCRRCSRPRRCCVGPARRVTPTDRGGHEPVPAVGQLDRVQRFLRQEPSPALETAVMATYTAGKWLIAEGAVAAAKSD